MIKQRQYRLKVYKSNHCIIYHVLNHFSFTVVPFAFHLSISISFLYLSYFLHISISKNKSFVKYQNVQKAAKKTTKVLNQKNTAIK